MLKSCMRILFSVKYSIQFAVILEKSNAHKGS